MKGIINIIIVIFLVAFVSGCDLINTGDNEELPDTSYRSGTEGIEINFMSGNPPNKFYENDPINAIVEIRNKGAFEKPYGKIFMYGYDSTILPFSHEKVYGITEYNYIEAEMPRIYAKNAYVKSGGYDTIVFEVFENEIDLQGSSSYEPNLVLAGCYHYQTFASETVCILPDSASLRMDEVCRPNTISMKSQGGPVAVTKIEEEIISDRINFVITIENVGKGTVVGSNANKYEKCPFALQPDDIDEVSVEVEIKGLPDPICNPNGQNIKLYNGKGTIHCYFETKPDGRELVTSGYTAPINILVDYHYLTKYQKNIEILSLRS